MIRYNALWLYLSLCLFCQNSFSAPSAKKTPVVIATNDWASQRVLSQVMGRLLEEIDIDVNYQQIKVEDQWGAFRMGLVDVQVELWQGTSIRQYNHSIKKGYFIDAGNHQAKAREEWWYPDYVKPLCPGLPNWRALLNCADVFANKDSGNKGVYYSGQWNTGEGTRIRALKLDFVIKRLENDTALWQKLSTSLQTRQPIIILNWTPNWTDTRMKGEFVEFPDYDDNCVTHASWGINKRLTMDCGNPRQGWVKKVASSKLKFTQPCAFKTLENVTFTTQMIAEAAAFVITDKLSESDAASKWIGLHQDLWLSWLPQECVAKQ